MSLADQQRVMVRLMSSAPYRRAFFAAPADAHAQYGLTPEEFRVLRAIDERRVAVFNAVFAGKRFDYLDAAFPRTLAFLEARDPSVRARYAEEVPLSDDRVQEYARFHAWARARPVAPADAPLLEALCDFEHLARGRPLTPQGAAPRLTDDLRPASTGCAVVAEPNLDLPALVEGRDPARTPTRALVWNTDGRARVEALDARKEALFTACDGQAPLGDLAKRFGEEARADVARWLLAGLVRA